MSKLEYDNLVIKGLPCSTEFTQILGQGEKAEWRNSGMDITINLHIAIIVFTATQWVSRAWKFMPCKGVPTIEATATVKVSALA